MHSLKQLFRQSGKTVFGILLMMLAVAVLVVSLGQGLAARQTDRQLAFDFSTVALHPYIIHYNDRGWEVAGLSEDMKAWVEQVVAENPDLAKGYSQTLLASAYLPELTPEHYFDYASRPGGAAGGYKLPQDQAMFVVTLRSMEEPTELRVRSTHRYTDPDTGEVTTLVEEDRLVSVSVKVKARIDRVLSLSDCFQDPTGWTIELTFTVSTWKQYDAMDLEVGGQYLVSGMNYFDNTQLLGEYINEQRFLQGTAVAPFHISNLYFLTPEEKQQWVQYHNHYRAPDVIYGDKKYITQDLPTRINPSTGIQVIDSGKIMLFDVVEGDHLYENYLRKLHTAAMTVVDNTQTERETLTADGLVYQDYRWVIRDGEKVAMDLQQYRQMYGVPTVTRLTTSLEEFLEANPLWANALQYQQVNHRAFPVYGVDHLDYIVEFNRGTTRITQGREFTQEELDSGARVCVISESLAQRNGLQVGDTIDPQFYTVDLSVPYQDLATEDASFTAQSTPGYCFSGTEFLPAREYTIVGIYRQNNLWDDYFENNFAFTPNAIFVPNGSLADVPSVAPENGLYKVLVLENGAVSEFDRIVGSRDFPEWVDSFYQQERNLFVYSDMGYSQVKDTLVNYQQLGNRVMLVGALVYAIVLGLFILLFPGMMGKTLRTMATLGTPRSMKFKFMLTCALAVLIPGTILGAALGLSLWRVAVSYLLTAAGAAFTLTLDLGAYFLILLAQLLLAAALVSLLAIPMTRHKNLMQRK